MKPEPIKFTLKRHNIDSVMIEATYKYGDETFLSFVSHEDCFTRQGEHEDVLGAVDEHGSVVVEMRIVEEDDE